jgi:hypothetical protein
MTTTTTTRTGKATHSGTCQICGARQKLPHGILAKHGYNVKWGFFSGVCNGADHLPFEQSCDLVEAAIVAARMQIEVIAERIEAIRKQGGSRAWNNSYITDPRTRKSEYRWVEVEVKKVHRVIECTGYEYDKLVHVREDGKETDLYDNVHEDNAVENVAARMNEQYIKQVLQTRVANLKQYIAWQQERVASWKPAALTPVK